MAAGEKGRRLRVEHDKIGVGALIEAADLALKLERFSVAARRHPEKLEAREPDTLKHGDLIGLGHGGEHGIAGAAADIGGKTDRDFAPGLAQMRPGKESRAQKSIGGGAVNDFGSRFMESDAFAFGKMDAVGEEALRPQESEALIDCGVVTIIREEPLDGVELHPALGEMGLQID